MKVFKNSSNLITLLLISAVLSSGTFLSSCGAKKKAAKAEAERIRNEIETSKTTLKKLLDDNTKTIEEQETILADIKSKNLNDPELNELITKVEDKIRKEKEEKLKREEEERKKRELEEKKEVIILTTTQKLENYFDGIANANNIQTANNMINQALGLFTSDKANVLIIVSQSGDMKDYDKPTTIGKYLNLLKDVKRNNNRVEKIHYGSESKIKTLELIKK